MWKGWHKMYQFWPTLANFDNCDLYNYDIGVCTIVFIIIQWVISGPRSQDAKDKNICGRETPLVTDINKLSIFNSPYAWAKTCGLYTYMKICIWYPFECDMGLDGTLTSHIERVEDEFDMACQVPSNPISHENGYHMHFLARNNHRF